MDFILPDDSIFSYLDKARVQNSILIGVYGSTYPLGNIRRASEQIKDGIQRIIFWGNSSDEVFSGRGGTVALILDKSKGDSTVEMCRAGSNINNGGGTYAVTKLFEDFLSSGHNQLFATPRNCLDRTNFDGNTIPGGKAISIIYSKLKNVQFWGIAPWYIMPGNSLELLDLRICTKIDLCLEKLKKGEKLYIYSDFNKKIFSRMLENNYGITDLLGDDIIHSNLIKITNFSVKYEKNDVLRKYNYSMYEVSTDGFITLDLIDGSMNTIGSGVSLVKLDLFDKNNLGIQRNIELLGFKMVSLFPEGNSMMGYWFKSENKNYAIPYYFYEETGEDSSSLLIQREIINSIIY